MTLLHVENLRVSFPTRTGMIVGRNLANQYGWKIGQKVPIASNIFPQQDGSKNWTFDLVGIYDGKDEDWQRSTNAGWINFAYFDEANQFGRGMAGTYTIKLADPEQAEQVARTIDAMFENSPDETKTQTEKDFNIGFIRQIGDIGLIVRWILFAVFFTLLLVVGNTIAQSVRERIPELAILKTLGFSNGSVLGFVLSGVAPGALVERLSAWVAALVAGLLVHVVTHDLERDLPATFGGRVLDSGCGGGGTALSLGEESALAIGLDLDGRFFGSGTRLRAERGIAAAAFVQGDGQRLPFASGAFDLVLSHSVIEHVMDASAYLRECHRVLRPGGVLYLSTAPFLTISTLRNQFSVLFSLTTKITTG